MEEVTTALDELSIASVPVSAPPSPSFSALELLPSELLSTILELAVNDHTTRARQRWLSRACLTCRVLLDEATRLLWDQLEVDGNTKRTERLASAVESAVVHKRVVRSLEASNSPYTQRVIKNIEGLRELTLVNYGQNDCLEVRTILGLSQLKDLTSLTLFNVILNVRPQDDLTGLMTSLPSLKELTMREYRSSYSHPYSIFSHPNLRFFRLERSSSLAEDQTADFLHFFSSISGSLTTFEYQSPMFSELIPTFSSCSNLKHLGLQCLADELPTIIGLIPSQLRTITFFSTPDLSIYLSTFHSVLSQPSLGALSKVTFSYLHSKNIKNRDLLEALERNGVVVEYGYGRGLGFTQFP